MLVEPEPLVLVVVPEPLVLAVPDPLVLAVPAPPALAVLVLLAPPAPVASELVLVVVAVPVPAPPLPKIDVSVEPPQPTACDSPIIAKIVAYLKDDRFISTCCRVFVTTASITWHSPLCRGREVLRAEASNWLAVAPGIG